MTLPSSSPLRPGAAFGRYEIVRPLGAGGMGAVYEALHVELGKRVAIKALLPQLASRDDVRARMIREGRAAAQIRHPHVVDIFDVGTHEGITYLVMELLEGEDFGQHLKRVGPLSPEGAVEVLLPVLAGLSAAHARGVLHRDLKPANIFLTRGHHGEMAPKLLDFGIAKTLNIDAEQPLTTTGAIIGTPHYMSPEQVGASRDVTSASDQYSMGVIAYHALTGRPPFSSSSIYAVMNDVVHGRFAPLREARPDLPEPLAAAVDTAMQTGPDRRFASVLHFGAALLPFGSDRTRAQWTPVFGGPLTTATESAGGGPPAPVAAAPLARDAATLPRGEDRAEAAFAAAPDSVLDTQLPLRDAGVAPGRGWLVLGLALLLAGAVGAWYFSQPDAEVAPRADELEAPPAEPIREVDAPGPGPAPATPAAVAPARSAVEDAAAEPAAGPPEEPTVDRSPRRARPTRSAPRAAEPKRQPEPEPAPRPRSAPRREVELGTNDAPILQ